MARINLSQEAVDYQKNPELFVKMASCIGEYRQNHTGYDDGSLENSGLAELVNKKLNSNFKFCVAMWGMSAAWVNTNFTDEVSANTILNSKWKTIRGLQSNAKGAAIVRKNPETLGFVDRRNGKLGGLYSEIEIVICVSTGLLANREFTDEEIAAILLHEIGHAFSYFETLHHVVYTNLAIADAVEEAVGSKDPLYRVKIVKELKDDGLLPSQVNTDQVVKLNKDDMFGVLVSESLKDYSSRNECPYYNLTVAEQQADSFATRMGSGKYLASALSKIYNNKFLVACNVYCNVSVVARIILTPFVIMSGGFIGLFLMTMQHFLTIIVGWIQRNSQYDKPKERIKRIKNEMVAHLKKSGLKGKQLEHLLNQIDNVSKSMENTYHSESVAEWIVSWTINLFDGSSTAKERERAIEDLINNDLYVIGNKFKFIGK